MKPKHIIAIGMLAGLACIVALGQEPAGQQAAGTQPQPKPQMTMKEIKQKLGIVVFPAKGQTPEQQEADEWACLEWSLDQAGLGPNAGQQDAQAAGEAAKDQAEDATKGAAVVGAAKGAAVGAIFGAIVGETGEGAAIGAVGGALKGRKAKKQAEKQAEAQAEAKVAADNKAKLDTIKKGMAACLESKGYTVQ
jgi:Glycine-zipper domain